MARKKLTIDDYEITKDGRVINKTNNHVLTPQPNGKGYLRVKIDGKLQFVHRLVAQKYIPNPNNYEQVNHIDGDKTNNSVDNLEWVSNQQNREHAVESGLHLQGEDCKWAKLDWQKVEYIRNHPEISVKQYSEIYGVSQSTIKDVISYRTWKNKIEKICWTYMNNKYKN